MPPLLQYLRPHILVRCSHTIRSFLICSNVTWQIYVFTTTYLLVIKRDKVVSQNKGFPCIKLQTPLNTFSPEVMWQIKYVIYLLPKVPYHQKWLSDYLLIWEASTYKTTKLFKHAFFWDNVINQNHFISTIKIFKAVKYRSVETLGGKLPNH